MNYQDIFEEYTERNPYKKYYKIDDELSREKFIYRWRIVAIFHDIEYPVEIIGISQLLITVANPFQTNIKLILQLISEIFNELNTLVRG